MKYRYLNNVKCYAPSSREELIEYAYNNKAILVAVNAEKILNSNQETQTIINRNIGYPDGVGAVWSLLKKGVKNVVKIPGCELWLDIITKNQFDSSFYLIGGKEEVIQETVINLRKQYPSIQIVGFRNGYISNDKERNLLLNDISKKKPDIIFVAMGSPKQELLMEEMHKIHPALYQGLGGSFDVYTGNVKRAPQWWVKNNLEWAYRLINQPTRINRQIRLMKFFYLLKTKQI